MLSADDRRAARPRGTARHPAGDRRVGLVHCRGSSTRSVCCCSIRTTMAQRCDLRPIIEQGARRRRARRGRERSAGADALDAARRNGRRRRRRQLAAVRRAARLRRTARRVLRDARVVRPAGAGAHHRRVGRCARQGSLPHGAADARAAHPPREGDVEHLHGAGAAREHRGDVRGVSRPRRPAGDRRAGPQADARRRGGAAGAGPAPDQRAYFDTLRIEGADVTTVRQAAEAPESTSATTATRSASRSTRRPRSTMSARSSQCFAASGIRRRAPLHASRRIRVRSAGRAPS